MIHLKRLRKQYNTFTVRILTLLAAIAVIAYTEVLERFDFAVYDVISTFRPHTTDTDLVIVAIDEKSLQELGSWPWSRGIHAELINRLKSIDNKAAAFDVLFAELHTSDAHADRLLAQAIAAHGGIILPVAPTPGTETGLLNLITPHPLFSRNALLAHTDIELDSDSVSRRVFLHAGIDAPTWPTLGLALMEKAAGTAHQSTLTGSQSITLQGKFWVRSDEALMPFSGKPGSHPQISYSSVLFDDDVLAGLAGKTVIVGMTAIGMGTKLATPASPLNRQPMAGVEWHANVYTMLQQHRMIQPASKNWTVIATLSWIALILAAISRTKSHLSLLLLGFLLLALCAQYLLLHLVQLWIPPSAALLGTLAVYPLWNWRRINQFLRSFLINKIRSSTALETISDGVIITDTSDRIVYINRGAEHILRTQLSSVSGKLLRQIIDIQNTPEHALTPQSDAAPKPGLDTPGMLECQIRTALGSRRSVRITRNHLHDEQHTLIGSVISMSDITDTVKLAHRVAYHEEYDALTKLPNRTKLLSRFDQMIRTTHDDTQPITVFFVTLDNFKKINDAMGHQAGDKLLRKVSWRLVKTIDQKGMIARWGGDEFIVLVDGLNAQAVSVIAKKILNTIARYFEINGMKIFVSGSIGVSFYPQDGITSDIVVEKAGTAMYQAKSKGGNRFELYSPQSSDIWTRDRLELEKDLRSAIENGELQVFFQPIVDAGTHHIARMEALVRWQHPVRGFLSPAEFVPLAENVGLIEQLGEQVLRISCRSTCQLLRTGYPVKVSVNVSPRQLTNPNFLETVFSILRDTGLPSSALMLEITESAVVNNTNRVNEILQKIKSVGILIALDDFGTGYSSLTLLRELPIDILKIDKSFVRTLDQNQNDQKIVQAIIGLGKNLGLTIVAEGVETRLQSEILLRNDCQYQQGYFFSRPVPYLALLELIENKRIVEKYSAPH